ncbi:MAG: hypothetical protein ACOYKA_05515 [Legionellaceae bacterium]
MHRATEQYAEPDVEARRVAMSRYASALAELYGEHSIPAELELLETILQGGGSSRQTKSDWWGYESTRQYHFQVSIDSMVRKLNEDFNQGAQPFVYAGRYRSIGNALFCETEIRSTGAANLPETNFYFMMNLLSHPLMLLADATLLFLGCALFCMDGVGFILAGAMITAVAAASVAFVGMSAARRFGFFADHTEMNITAQQTARPEFFS